MHSTAAMIHRYGYFGRKVQHMVTAGVDDYHEHMEASLDEGYPGCFTLSSSYRSVEPKMLDRARAKGKKYYGSSVYPDDPEWPEGPGGPF